jgi:hypothetical protein
VRGAEKTRDRRPLKRKILYLAVVACAAVYVGQQSIQAQAIYRKTTFDLAAPARWVPNALRAIFDRDAGLKMLCVIPRSALGSITPGNPDSRYLTDLFFCPLDNLLS